MREVILIGGKFHRKRIEIEDRQTVIRMAKMPEFSPFKIDVDNILEIDYITYRELSRMFYQFEIVAPNVFIEESINPIDFIKNIVLDYIR